jgi:hypothetical protein
MSDKSSFIDIYRRFGASGLIPVLPRHGSISAPEQALRAGLGWA